MESYLRNSSLNWAYFYQGKGVEELRHSLLCATLELETTRMQAQEEIKRKEDQVNHLKDLLDKTVKERDDALTKCQRLVDKLIIIQQFQLQQQQQQQQQQQEQLQQQQNHQTHPISGVSSIEDEARRGDSNTGISSSDCEESIVSSPVTDPIPQPRVPVASRPTLLQLTPEKPLPEKGKLLQAVMKAGPLLQTLLLAGPLPQWRHPPPPLDSFEIPPVSIPTPPPPPPNSLLHQSGSNIHNNSIANYASASNLINKKRNMMVCEEADLMSDLKCQRIRFR